MARWLYDPQATAAAGVICFRRPYPRAEWLDDMNWNQFAMDAMQHVTEADRVFSMPGEQWGPREDAFFRAMTEGLAHANL
jgi:hypothetical protein